MDPIQFLRLAEWLLNNQPHPAGWRSAMSRAYYAAHHVVKQFVESTGATILASSSAHADVWNLLVECDDPEIEQVGSDLSELHSKRIDADYRLNLPSAHNPKTAEFVVKQAKTVIEIVDQAQKDKVRFERVKKRILV